MPLEERWPECIKCGYYTSITFDFYKTGLFGPKTAKTEFVHVFVQNVDYRWYDVLRRHLIGLIENRYKA